MSKIGLLLVLVFFMGCTSNGITGSATLGSEIESECIVGCVNVCESNSECLSICIDKHCKETGQNSITGVI